MSVDAPAVELIGVSARYDAPGAVVVDVNLSIQAGEFVAFIGPNGGGKTTLVRVILGLIIPYAGVARVFGGSIENNRSCVGYVPQFSTCRRDFPITVSRMVQLALLNAGVSGIVSRGDEAHRVEQALYKVGLVGLGESRIGELSGGQLQRALIAQALVREPKLLILDEPTASIDPGGEASLLELFEELNKQMTIILVSHDVHYVMRSVGRVACVNRQVIVHAASELDHMDTHAIYGVGLKPVTHDHPPHPHHPEGAPRGHALESSK
jgi:zinc transport system ATP-binding protein